LNNVLEGLGGNDKLVGKDNVDTAEYQGNRDDYNIFKQNGFLEIADSVEGRDGVDELHGIERVQFQDEILDTNDIKPFSEALEQKDLYLTLAKFADAAYEDTDGGAKDLLYNLNDEGWTFLGIPSSNESSMVPVDSIESPWFENENSQALVAEKGDAVVLSFRGTDEPGVGVLRGMMEYILQVNHDGEEFTGENIKNSLGNNWGQVQNLLDEIKKAVSPSENANITLDLINNANDAITDIADTYGTIDEATETLQDFLFATGDGLLGWADEIISFGTETLGILRYVPHPLAQVVGHTAHALDETAENITELTKKAIKVAAFTYPWLEKDDSYHWIEQGNHYDQLESLKTSVFNYINSSNHIDKLYVTGHSLGGVMASWYLTDMDMGGAELKNMVQVQGAGFAAPEILVHNDDEMRDLSADIPYTRFEVARDLVPDVVEVAEHGTVGESIWPFGIGDEKILDLFSSNPGRQMNLVSTYDIRDYTDALSMGLHEISHYKENIGFMKDVGLLADLDFAAYERDIYDTYPENGDGVWDPILLKEYDDSSEGANIKGDPGGMFKEWNSAEQWSENDVLVGTTENDILQGDGSWGPFGEDATNDLFYPGLGSDWIYGDDKNDDQGGRDVVAYKFEDINLDEIEAGGYEAISSDRFIHRTDEWHDGDGGIDKVELSLWGENGPTDSLHDIEALHFIDQPSKEANLLAGFGNLDANDNFDGLDGDDLLFGGLGDDILTGNAGNDRIHGGTGEDIASYSGYMDDYSIGIDDWSLQISDTISNRDGTDNLYEVEKIEFADGQWNTSDLLGDLYSHSDLLEMYSPVLALHEDDFIPTSIEAFLDHSILFDGSNDNPLAFGSAFGEVGDSVTEYDGGFWNADDSYEIEHSLLPESIDDIEGNFEEDHSYFLDLITGNDGHFGDIGPGSEPGNGEWATTFDIAEIEEQYGPTVYGKVNEGDGSIFLQYYFFYLANDWTDYVPNAPLDMSHAGFHEGEWEFMQIELDDNLLPKNFMSSIHLDDAAVRNPFDHDVKQIGNHPVVYGADGGHATYFNEGENDMKSVDMFGYDIGTATDARFGEKYFLPENENSSSVITDGLGNEFGLNNSNSQNYNLVEITDNSDEQRWLDLDMDWGYDVFGSTSFSDPPPSPVHNEDDRWDDPSAWLADKNLQGSERYDNQDGDIQLIGIDGGNMELGYLFHNTNLGALGHFDLA
jgi:hypothetical protein